MSELKYSVKIKDLRNMTMAIYDGSGSEVRELVPGENIGAWVEEFGIECARDIIRSYLEIKKILEGEAE